MYLLIFSAGEESRTETYERERERFQSSVFSGGRIPNTGNDASFPRKVNNFVFTNEKYILYKDGCKIAN